MAMGKVLVADDDKNICELLRLYLVKEGFQVVLAGDGEEALARFTAENPDIILLDVMMPRLDGWQVCREIRKKSECPIIMITAKGETFDKVLGLELGADDYVRPKRSWHESKQFCAVPENPPQKTISKKYPTTSWWST